MEQTATRAANTLDVISNPEKWLLRPYLTLINVERIRPVAGFIMEGNRSAIYMGDLNTSLEDLKLCMYKTVEDLIADGWRIA